MYTLYFKMMITITSVNIHHPTVTIFFLVMKTSKIYFSNCQINNLVLTTVIMLYVTSQNLFIMGSFHLLVVFTHLPHLPSPCLWQPRIWSVSITSFFFLDSPYKWDYTVFVFVFLWLISLNIMPSRPFHIVTNCRISFIFMAK